MTKIQNKMFGGKERLAYHRERQHKIEYLTRLLFGHAYGEGLCLHKKARRHDTDGINRYLGKSYEDFRPVECILNSLLLSISLQIGSGLEESEWK